MANRLSSGLQLVRDGGRTVGSDAPTVTCPLYESPARFRELTRFEHLFLGLFILVPRQRLHARLPDAKTAAPKGPTAPQPTRSTTIYYAITMRLLLVLAALAVVAPLAMAGCPPGGSGPSLEQMCPGNLLVNGDFEVSLVCGAGRRHIPRCRADCALDPGPSLGGMHARGYAHCVRSSHRQRTHA